MSSRARRQQAHRAGGEGGSGSCSKESSSRRADQDGDRMGASEGSTRSRSRGASPPPMPFHYLNCQKRLLREYARVRLGLGTRWRSFLPSIVSANGTHLDQTPSSQWTQVSVGAGAGAWT